MYLCDCLDGAHLSQAQHARTKKCGGFGVNATGFSICCGWDSRAPDMESLCFRFELRQQFSFVLRLIRVQSFAV
jgi:hypothetical protein